ncbi:hypothetical protein [Kordia sp.]|uniref:hypothetical protein n=1 Tax=Kordia sp. TaxID=1965332 RepID=UPI0025B7D4C4|nr:hypothetical protein [Kordia sp.]MCH2196167.1 hypothetical protein [Kordia sp.]
MAPNSYMYSFELGRATQFSANTGMNCEIQENGSVTGVIEVGNETELHVTLVPKTAQYYMSTESTSLQFTEVFTVNASLQVFGTGMIGTNSEDGIYIAHRGYYDGQAQRVLKVDLESGLQTEQIVNNYNFTYSKLHVIANQLALVNTQKISLYNSNFSTVPTS